MCSVEEMYTLSSGDEYQSLFADKKINSHDKCDLFLERTCLCVCRLWQQKVQDHENQQVLCMLSHFTSCIVFFVFCTDVVSEACVQVLSLWM